jgi:hypothetical protein
MLLELLNKAQKLFCGLHLEKQMKAREQDFSGKIVPLFPGSESWLLDNFK